MLKQALMTASLALLLAGPASADNDKPRGHYVPNKVQPKDTRHDGRDRGRDRGDDRQDWRGHDGRGDDGRREEWRGRDGRHDDDWRRSDGWRRDDDWRFERWHDNRHWRYVPPSHYRIDFGYRSGYELAWRDWQSYGRYDRYWRRRPAYGYGVGLAYQSGYDAGWRDASLYFGRGYRPGYWAYDPRDGWFFSFHIEG